MKKAKIINMPRKIVICSNILWTITNFRKDLILALQKSGYDVFAIGSNESFSDDLNSEIKKLNIRIIVIPLDRSGKNIFKEIKYFGTLYKCLQKLRPDIALHFSIKPNIYGSIACKILNIPFINTINGLGSGIIHNNFTSFLLKKLYSFSLKSSQKVLFQNTDDKNYFLENKLISIEKAGYVAGSGINVDDYYLPIKNIDEKKVFLFVGRLLIDKGLYEYIKVANEIKKENKNNVEFLVAGIFDKSNPSAISKDEMNTWVNDGIVRYLGKTDNIKEFFIMSDFIVLPSYREGLSRLLLEAASCQKVLISTNVPGCKDIVKDGFNGFLCESKDEKSLKSAIEKALNLNNDDYSIFAANSRELVINNFTDSIVNTIYLNEINKVLIKR